MRIMPSERGFALPITIFLVTIITLMLVAAFVRVEADRRVADSNGSTIDALAVAKSGLQRYMAYYDSTQVRPLDGDSLRINLTGGFADVVAHLVRVPVDSFEAHMYMVRSRGTVIEPTRGADPQAVRTVAQFARWLQGGTRKVAAMTSINRTHYEFDPGTAVVIDGNDYCPTPTPAITGFRGASDSDFPGTPAGSPPTKIQDSWNVVANEVGIDWSDIENGDVEADYTSVIDGDTTFATYIITGDIDFTDITGTGLLIVKDKMDTEGTRFEWDGVILVGDDLDPNADTTIIRGLVVTGLDKQVSQPTANNGFADDDDNIFIYHHSCNIQRALERFRGFEPIRNAWVDNWAEY